MFYSTVFYCTLYHTVLYCVLLYLPGQVDVILSTVLYATVLYSITLYSTVFYCTFQGRLMAFLRSLSTSFNFSSMSVASLIFTIPETHNIKYIYISHLNIGLFNCIPVALLYKSATVESVVAYQPQIVTFFIF